MRRRKPAADLTSDSLSQSSTTKGLTMRIINSVPSQRTFIVALTCVVLLILILPSVVHLPGKTYVLDKDVPGKLVPLEKKTARVESEPFKILTASFNNIASPRFPRRGRGSRAGVKSRTRGDWTA
jgi:hypothetical protein